MIICLVPKLTSNLVKPGSIKEMGLRREEQNGMVCKSHRLYHLNNLQLNFSYISCSFLVD